jgi:type I restriction enzyme S subunit
MEGWIEHRLGELCTITSSKRIFYDDYVSVGIPFYRSKEIIEKAGGNDISTELFITEKKYNEIKSKFGVPQKGDILLSSVGTLGIPYRVREQEVFYFKDGNLTWLKDFKNEIDSQYLLYWIKSNSGQEAIDNITIGSTQAAITIQDLKGISLLIPPLPLQRRIAEILGALDDKIELNRHMNHTLEQMAQALYKHYFVDGIDPENLPEGWKSGMLEEAVNIRGGGTPSTKESKFWNGSINWTSPKDLANHKSLFLTDTESKLTELGLKKVSSGLLPIGTVLLSSRAPIGYIAIADIPVAINQGYIAILPDSLFSRHFMYFWLKNNLDLIIQYANGSTFLEISKKAFREIECLIPPDNLIQKFIQAVKPQFDLIRNSTYEAETLIKAREYLLPKLISGEIIPSGLQTIEQAL